MPSRSPSTEPTATSEPLIHPLENGDCLSRREFERRYEAMPWLKKAELIEGVAYVGDRVTIDHGTANAQLLTWLGMYTVPTPQAQCLAHVSTRLDWFNEVQPDAVLRRATGGQSRIGDDKQFLEGSPELAAEVASSSVSRDLHAKLKLYLRHGVREYIVWRVLDGDIDWFRLEDGEYRRLALGEDGIFRCREFPGLWLDRAALLRGDMATVLDVLTQGLSSPEHAQFGARQA
jgi:Uma2 family endonuclease